MSKRKAQIEDSVLVYDCPLEETEAPINYEELCTELRKENSRLLSENQRLKEGIETYRNANFKQGNELEHIRNIAKVSVGFVQQMESIIENAKTIYDILEPKEEK
jgi:hypothetical protein